MEVILLKLLENGGPLGWLVGIIIVVFAVALLAKQKGFFIYSRQDTTLPEQFRKVSKKVDELGERLAHVETDLKQRPTRDDMINIQLVVVRLEENLKSVGKTTEETRQSVGRIENYMLDLGKQKNA